MPRFLPSLTVLLALSSGISALPAYGAIQLAGTRAIMNESDRDVPIYARNLGDEALVVQTWIEGEQGEMDTPFFISPPLSRFDGKAERSLNIAKVGDGLPPDRESYFWVNVLEIPQRVGADVSNLSLATRTRIKLFYRPSAIADLPRGPDQLSWQVQRQGNECRLRIENRSVFNMNFSAIAIDGEAPTFGRGVVATPLTSTDVPLTQCPSGSVAVVPQVVNDVGVTQDWPAITVAAP